MPPGRPMILTILNTIFNTSAIQGCINIWSFAAIMDIPLLLANENVKYRQKSNSSLTSLFPKNAEGQFHECPLRE